MWSWDTIIVNSAVTLVFIGGLARNWFVQRGRLRQVYWLMIFMSLCSIILNCTIALEKPSYSGLYLFNILTIHSLWSATRGLIRLNNQEISK